LRATPTNASSARVQTQDHLFRSIKSIAAIA